MGTECGVCFTPAMLSEYSGKHLWTKQMLLVKPFMHHMVHILVLRLIVNPLYTLVLVRKTICNTKCHVQNIMSLDSSQELGSCACNMQLLLLCIAEMGKIHVISSCSMAGCVVQSLLTQGHDRIAVGVKHLETQPLGEWTVHTDPRLLFRH